MTAYFVYDVFTEAAFGGNQLAVIPDGRGHAEDKLQKIAREFNFSETVFLYPADNPDHTAKVRIFTPTAEIPFAGHPTIGAVVALCDEGHRGDAILELGVGPLRCTYENGVASFTTTTPFEEYATPELALVAGALSLPVEAINTSTHQPVQAGVGLPFVMVELHSSDQLDACVAAVDKMRIGAARYPASVDFPLFAYVRNGSQINARMFAPLDNIPEDPATGSAAAALATLLTRLQKRDMSFEITQGEAMGRPSHISAQTQYAPEASVTISGRALRTMQGTLLV